MLLCEFVMTWRTPAGFGDDRRSVGRTVFLPLPFHLAGRSVKRGKGASTLRTHGGDQRSAIDHRRRSLSVQRRTVAIEIPEFFSARRVPAGQNAADSNCVYSRLPATTGVDFGPLPCAVAAGFIWYGAA